MSTTTSQHEQQLDNLLKRIRVIDEKSYEVDGKVLRVYHQQPHSAQPAPLADFGSNNNLARTQVRELLTNQLTNTLYATFYCGIPSDQKKRFIPATKERNGFMEFLSYSNNSKPDPDKNWQVYAVDPQGNAFAQKNGELRQVLPNSFVPDPMYPTLAVNQTISFVRQRENKVAQPVFYYVFSDTYMAPDCPMVRIYWNIKPEGAALLIDRLTKVLNGYRIPFQFKCLNHPDLYHRNDSAVLYFDKADLSIIQLLLKPIIEVVRPYLVDRLPLFVDPLDTGVGMAEDPGNGQSFGMDRVSVIAEALVTAFEDDLTDHDARKAWVIECLKQKGISHERMSVNTHSHLITIKH